MQQRYFNRPDLIGFHRYFGGLVNSVNEIIFPMKFYAHSSPQLRHMQSADRCRLLFSLMPRRHHSLHDDSIFSTQSTEFPSLLRYQLKHHQFPLNYLYADLVDTMSFLALHQLPPLHVMQSVGAMVVGDELLKDDENTQLAIALRFPELSLDILRQWMRVLGGSGVGGSVNSTLTYGC